MEEKWKLVYVMKDKLYKPYEKYILKYTFK